MSPNPVESGDDILRVSMAERGWRARGRSDTIATMKPTGPQPPAKIPEHAEACLRALAARGFGHVISIGGGLGLLHYLDYRLTYDVDAWWSAQVTSGERRQVVALLEETLGSFGTVKTRAWGDVVSVELRREGQTVFSFQIAHRSAQLEQSLPTAWGGLLLDSFPDLVASKMVALVERGAPRDFRDIHAICQAGLITPRECWALWARRQVAAGNDADPARARLAVQTHLARIEQHRRLDQITSPDQRAEAERVRAWFGQECLNAIE